MGTYEVFIIEATYVTEKQQAVVELYGKFKDGRSVIVRYRDFQPYCFVTYNKEEEARFKQKIQNQFRKAIVTIEPTQLKRTNKVLDCFKITFNQPSDVKRFRDWKPKRNEVFSGDIVYGLRFFYDLDLGVCIDVEGELTDNTNGANKNLGAHWIIDADIISRSADYFTPPISILSFDIEASPTEENIYCICCVFEPGDGTERTRIEIDHPDNDERYILSEFERVVQELNPDIITGYNIIHYDIPQLAKRCEVNRRRRVHVGRDTKSGFNQRGGKMDKYWVRGRCVADAWWWVKKLKKPQRETLRFVSQEYLGHTKLDIDPTQIDKEWPSRRPEIIAYCTVDAELALDLILKLRVVNRIVALSKISKLPLRNVFDDETSRLVDSLLVRAADDEGWAVPCGGEYDEDHAKIEGAKVYDTKGGLYKWVVVFDFGSLYPSLVIANNLCFSTYAPEDGEIVTPIKARFVAKSERVGILPRILTGLHQERDKYKALRKENKDNQELYDYYDLMQESVKILMNSFYGVLASSFYRFTNPDIGGSITGYGRVAIKRIIYTMIGRKVKVICGDTDSIFVVSPEPTVEGAVEFGNRVANEFTTEDLVFEFEKVLSSWFSHGKKKRYISRVAWPEEGEIYARGYETRRTDSFTAATGALQEAFNLILDDKSDEAINLALKVVKEVKEGRTPLDALVVSKGCKDFATYSNPGSLAQVQTAKKNIKRGYPFIPGMKVSWIVTNANSSPQTVEPWHGPESWKWTPDWSYYAKRAADILGRATEWFGWGARDLLTGTRATSLEAFM